MVYDVKKGSEESIRSNFGKENISTADQVLDYAALTLVQIS